MDSYRRFTISKRFTQFPIIPKQPRTQPNHRYQSTHPNHQIIKIKQSETHLLDVVVAQSTAILQLLTSEDQTLLIRGNALLVLDLGLDVVDGVARLNVEGNGLTRQGLDETVYPKSAVTIPLSVCLSFVSTP